MILRLVFTHVSVLPLPCLVSALKPSGNYATAQMLTTPQVHTKYKIESCLSMYSLWLLPRFALYSRGYHKWLQGLRPTKINQKLF